MEISLEQDAARITQIKIVIAREKAFPLIRLRYSIAFPALRRMIFIDEINWSDAILLPSYGESAIFITCL